MSTPEIVLASTSPFRRALLDRLRLPFVAEPPHADETPLPDEEPTALVRRLSVAKAQSLRSAHPGALIIGSDQCAVLDERILGKPGNHSRAREQLRAASGRSVVFHTGLCLLQADSGAGEVADVRCTVHFRALDDARIERYLEAEQPYQCAGSFKAEGLGIALFERLEGEDPTALVGLPLIRLVSMLGAAGVALP